MGFETFKLHPELLKALTACGFVTPSSIQEKSLIYCNFQVDMIIAAKTVTFPHFILSRFIFNYFPLSSPSAREAAKL